MVTVADLTLYYRQAFDDHQARVLAEAAVHIESDLVRREDFTKLTAILDRVAEGQDRFARRQDVFSERLDRIAESEQRTAETLDRLAASHDRLSQRQDAFAEKLDRLVDSQQRLAESQDRLAESQDRLAESQQRLTEGQDCLTASHDRLSQRQDAFAEKLDRLADSQQRLAESQQRLTEGQNRLTEGQNRLTEGQNRLTAALEQLSWTVSDVKKQLGGLGQTAGYAVEAYVLERLPKLLARRYGFIETSAMPETFTHPDGSIDEIDVIMRGTIDGRPVAFIGETKTNITPREVADFLKVVERVRPAMQCADVRAIFFAYRASGDARQAVAAVGSYLAFPHDIIVQPG